MLNRMKAPSKRVILSVSAVSMLVVIVVLSGTRQHEANQEHETREVARRGDHPKSLRKLNGYRGTDYTEAANSNGRCRLPENAIENVKTFVLFTGYPRSGHSILGSMMNAHPHMAIAYNYVAVSKQWNLYQERHISRAKAKSKLFNSVFVHSCRIQNFKHENNSKKGYTLSIDYPWWGSYKEDLHVIGERSAGFMTDLYMKNETWFKQSYKQLLKTVEIPVKVIHVVRNPFDLISTSLIYSAGKREEKHTNGSTTAFDFVLNLKSKALNETTQTKCGNITYLQTKIRSLFKMADAVTSMIALYGRENVLDVHNSDLVMQPKRTLKRICAFLQLKCPVDYVEACADKTFKSLSKTRDIVEWPSRLRKMVEERIQEYPFFQRYSFDNDYSTHD